MLIPSLIAIKWGIVAGLGIVVAWYSYRLGYGRVQTRMAAKLNASTTCPPCKDADQSALHVKYFLRDAAEERGMNISDLCRNQVKCDLDILPGTIRLLHAAGYKLVIRQVSDSDIEE